MSDAEIVKRPVGTRFRDRPFAYLLPPQATEAVAMLRRHGIVVERLAEPVEISVETGALFPKAALQSHLDDPEAHPAPTIPINKLMPPVPLPSISPG